MKSKILFLLVFTFGIITSQTANASNKEDNAKDEKVIKVDRDACHPVGILFQSNLPTSGYTYSGVVNSKTGADASKLISVTVTTFKVYITPLPGSEGGSYKVILNVGAGYQAFVEFSVCK
ncbi:MAG: hypothetical protein ACEPOV_05005 [Hyphomicrobiales bacterium]